MVICTLHSENRKTGDMVQTWILDQAADPVTCCQHGWDTSTCGDCPRRGWVDRTGNHGRWCYVAEHQAPFQIWHSWRGELYPKYRPVQHDKYLRGRRIRLGAYGDPCAAPYRIWSRLAKLSSGWTGYTHQWRQRRFWRFKQLLMASCETIEHTQAAIAQGWRTFRCMPHLAILSPEILCPASKEAGESVQCIQCRLCAGKSRPAKSISIITHGSKARMANYHRYIQTIAHNPAQ